MILIYFIFDTSIICQTPRRFDNLGNLRQKIIFHRGANGTGASIEATRITGASSHSNASSAMMAEISPPMPPVKEDSCKTSARFVFLTVSRIASLSIGASVRKSITSICKPSSFSKISAASSAFKTCAPNVIIDKSLAFARRSRFTDFDDVIFRPAILRADAADDKVFYVRKTKPDQDRESPL